MADTRTTLRELELDLRVAARDQLADGVVRLTLVDPDGGTLPPWMPGAHVDLVLTDDLVRQYSLCGSPSDTDRLQVAVLREPDGRGGSAYVHDELPVGGTVRVRGPRNHFPLLASSHYVFVAGGIGITPLLAMIAEADAVGADWALHYTGRSRRSMAFLDDLAAHGDRVHVVARDESDRLHLEQVVADLPEGALVYACGPERLLEALEQACPADVLNLERFSARADLTTESDTGFELVLARSGLTLHVPPDRSVFDVAQDAGVSVLGSCHEGICGTCEQYVLEGEVDHRDSILSESERAANDAMMICVSRSLSPRLTLDL